MTKRLKTCGCCIHFQKEKHESLDAVCINLGKRSFGKICGHFRNNPYRVDCLDVISNLSTLVSKMPVDDIPKLIELLEGYKDIHDKGFAPFEPVAYKLNNLKNVECYLSDYITAHVVAVDDVYLYLSTNVKYPYAIKSHIRSVLRKDKFLKVKQNLMERKRLVRRVHKSAIPNLTGCTNYTVTNEELLKLEDVPIVNVNKLTKQNNIPNKIT